jgi:hypothetical protein
MQSDASYFGTRAAEEFIAGAEAKHPEARRAHLELAVRYNDLARHIALQDQLVLAGEPKKKLSASNPAHATRRSGLWL